MTKLLGVSLPLLIRISYPRVYPIQDIAHTENFGYTDSNTKRFVKPMIVPACEDKVSPSSK